MLKNIHPLLNADLLHALRSMGHGDEIVVVDPHFPAVSVARETVLGQPLRVDASVPEVIDALLSVLVLDTFVDNPARRMEVVGDPERIPEVQQAVQERIRPVVLQPVERMAFYEQARRAFCVLVTADTRPYGCFILKKGVLADVSPVRAG